ncbi:MAG: hypothetical protein E7278_09895 [Lachnospiraceae bacterium]|nr:hypothetical protein [Lachnospiraceae bacterium]
MKRKLHGNITVYMGLTTGIILSLVFSLLEVVHLVSLGQEKEILSQLGAESVLADYNRPLWTDYGILAVDAGYGDAQFQKAAVENRALSYVEVNSNNSLLSLDATGVNLKGYTLLSDSNGRAFLKEAAMAELYGIPQELLQQQTGLCQQMESDATSDISMEDMLNNAQSSLDEAESLREENQESSKEGTSTALPSEPVENPILKVQEWRANGVLAQVLPSDVTLSGGTLSDQRPSKRTLQTGSLPAPAISATDRVLYGLYLRDHLQSYTHPRHHEGLAYEWEYILNGKSSDEENLRLTVEKLLALREVQNFIAIQRIEKCTLAAEATATALVGFTGNPAIIKGVKQGILAAWAYMESVLDVRTLLAGGKIPFVKNDGDWTSDIANLGNCFDVNTKAKESEGGISYDAYLVAFTYLESEEHVGLRCLDVAEAAICAHPGYEKCRVDNLLVKGQFVFSYEGKPTFASMVPALRGKVGRYSFLREWELAYYT